MESMYVTFKGGGEDMNHPLVDRIERFGTPIIRKSPALKRCSCGCGETVSVAFCHTVYEDQYFVDNFHVIAHLKDIGLLQEVG
jgi:hypothetical protein